jgi:hypothetical protein
MLAASAQSYSVIILVLLQLLQMQVIAGRTANNSKENVLVSCAGKSIVVDLLVGG